MVNWINKVLKISEKIKRIIKKRPSKQEVENSDWISCCKGPILKKELENNLWVCPSCNKHHRINCRQRFDIVFGKNNYEILKTPIPLEDPLNWKDSKTYKERLKIAREKLILQQAHLIFHLLEHQLELPRVKQSFMVSSMQ